MSSWYIWAIKINKFDEVERYISTIPEIDEYLYPTTTKEYKLKAGVRKKRVPLYSGYLFLKYRNTPEVFYKLNTFPFITTYVGVCSGEDLSIVKEVRELEYINLFNKEIHVDDVVKVNSGPFLGLSGNVVSTTSANVCVALTVFGRSVNVTFNKDDIDIIKR